MSRFDQMDVTIELIELCNELQQDISMQLNYYRASVYKEETAGIINRKIDQLKMVVALLNQEEISDLFCDYEASRSNGNIAVAPGECLLSTRLANLFQHLGQSFDELLEACQTHRSQQINVQDFTKNVRKHRRQLLALCRQGSRQWSFFQTV